MSEIEWNHITIFLILLSFAVGVFNMGAVMAFMTRRTVENGTLPKKSFGMFYIVFLSGLFGLFAMPAPLVICSFPDYGWKLWPGEIKHPRNKWAARLFDLEFKDRERREHRKRKAETIGNCESIWE